MLVEIPDADLQILISGLGSALEAMLPESAERTALRLFLRRLTVDREVATEGTANPSAVCGLLGSGVVVRNGSVRLDVGGSVTGGNDNVVSDSGSPAGSKEGGDGDA